VMPGKKKTKAKAEVEEQAFPGFSRHGRAIPLRTALPLQPPYNKEVEEGKEAELNLTIIAQGRCSTRNYPCKATPDTKLYSLFLRASVTDFGRGLLVTVPRMPEVLYSSRKNAQDTLRELDIKDGDEVQIRALYRHEASPQKAPPHARKGVEGPLAWGLFPAQEGRNPLSAWLQQHNLEDFEAILRDNESGTFRHIRGGKKWFIEEWIGDIAKSQLSPPPRKSRVVEAGKI